MLRTGMTVSHEGELTLMTTFIQVVLLLMMILINGVLAMSELALVSARKSRLEALAEDGSKGAERALKLANDPTRFLSTVQIGITLVGVLAGAFGGATLAGGLQAVLERVPFLVPYAAALSVGVVVAITTYLSLVVGELVPKRVAMSNPERVAVLVAGPMTVLAAITAPLVRVLSVSTNTVLRFLRIEHERGDVVTEDDVRAMLEEASNSGTVRPAERDVVERVFVLDDRPIDTVMTPRPRLMYIDLDDPLSDNLERMMEAGRAVYPAYTDNPDQIVGVLSLKEVFNRVVQGGDFDLRELVREPLIVPESALVNQVLENFRTAGRRLALVVDEHGGVQGVVTLHDIVELLLGALPDGADDTPTVIRRADGTLLVDALLPLVELNEYLESDDLPDESEDFHTVGGYVLARMDRVPREGESVSIPGYVFEVIDMDGNRIDKVLVHINKEHADKPAAD